MNDDEGLIHSYSRADAIADGVLVDVTETAKEAAIKYPTALTSTIFEGYVRVPPGLEAQDESGRLWAILWILKLAIARAPNCDSLRFTVLVRNDNNAPQLVELKALCHPGDGAEPVITILLIDED